MNVVSLKFLSRKTDLSQQSADLDQSYDWRLIEKGSTLHLAVPLKLTN